MMESDENDRFDIIIDTDKCDDNTAETGESRRGVDRKPREAGFDLRARCLFVQDCLPS